MSVFERVVLTLWVGGLWTTGLVLAPVLFASFPRVYAGDIAGRLFTAMSFLGMACGLILIAFSMIRCKTRVWRDWRTLVLAAMLVITVTGEFMLAQRMRMIRQAAAYHTQESPLRSEFGMLHGISNGLYLVTAVLGLVLVVGGVRPRRDQAGS
jgi:hydrogenase-4 membrane subunit HyfE